MFQLFFYYDEFILGVDIMKKIVLLLVGFLPLLFGYLLNYLMMNGNIPLLLINIAMLIIWFFVGMFSIKLVDKKIESLLLLNAPAFIVLLLLLFQEIVLGQYWFHPVGMATQFFYLSVLKLALSITSMLHRVFYAYIIAFLFMLITSCSGRIISERRK